MNVTVTQTQSDLIYRWQREPRAFEEKLKALLHAMKETPAAETITEWEQLFFRDYNPHSPLDIEKEKAARALCFLLSNTVEPLIPELASNLKTLIQETLPQSKDADAFILQYKLEEAHFLLDELEENLFAEANQINETIADKYIELEKELLAINAERKMNSPQLFQKLDGVKANIRELISQLNNIAQEMYQTGQEGSA